MQVLEQNFTRSRVLREQGSGVTCEAALKLPRDGRGVGRPSRGVPPQLLRRDCKKRAGCCADAHHRSDWCKPRQKLVRLQLVNTLVLRNAVTLAHRSVHKNMASAFPKEWTFQTRDAATRWGILPAPSGEVERGGYLTWLVVMSLSQCSPTAVPRAAQP